MNASTHSVAAIETHQGRKSFRNRDLDTVPKMASCNELTQATNTVRPNVLDTDDFETFIDGAGI